MRFVWDIKKMCLEIINTLLWINHRKFLKEVYIIINILSNLVGLKSEAISKVWLLYDSFTCPEI